MKAWSIALFYSNAPNAGARSKLPTLHYELTIQWIAALLSEFLIHATGGFKQKFLPMLLEFTTHISTQDGLLLLKKLLLLTNKPQIFCHAIIN